MPTIPTILLVDDEPAVCAALAAYCNDAGFHYLTAPDGEAGLRAFLKHRPALVVTDIRMPRMSGFQLIARIRAHSAVPIIVLSILRQAPDVAQAIALGATDYLVKPVALSAFCEKVNAALQHTPTGPSSRRSRSSPLKEHQP